MNVISIIQVHFCSDDFLEFSAVVYKLQKSRPKHSPKIRFRPVYWIIGWPSGILFTSNHNRLGSVWVYFFVIYILLSTSENLKSKFCTNFDFASKSFSLDNFHQNFEHSIRNCVKSARSQVFVFDVKYALQKREWPWTIIWPHFIFSETSLF